MADNTINIDLIINAAKSAKTLEQQREALKDLRKGLDEVRQGSGAFELLTEEVSSLQKEMGVLNLTFEDAYGEIKPLTNQIGELEDRLYQLALAGKQNTDEFQQVQAETVRLKKSLREVDDTVDALAQRGSKLRGFIQVAEGIASGFAVAQGALALFGTENEEVEKAILKVQGAMSLLAGIQALSTALTEKNALFTGINTAAKTANTTATVVNTAAQGAATTAIVAETEATVGASIATRIWNAILKVNPLFLLAGVIIGVVSAIYAFSKATGIATAASESLNKALEFQNQLLNYQKDAALQAAQSRLALAEAEGKSETELSKLKLQEINLRESYDKKELANIEKRLSTQKKLRSQYTFDGNKEKVEETKTTIEELNKQKDVIESNLRDQQGLGNSYQIQRKILNLNTNKAIQKDNKSTSDAYNKDLKNDTKNTQDELEQRKNAQKEYYQELDRLRAEDQDLNDALVDENFYKYSTESAKFFNELEKNYKNDLIKYEKSLNDRTEKDKENVAKKIITQTEADANLLENQRVFEELKNNRLRKFELDAGKFRSDIERKIVEDTLKLNKTELDNKLDKLSKEAKAKKDSYDKERELNKKLSDSTKKTLTEETLALTLNIENKNKVLAKYDKERAAAVEAMNAATSQQARQDQVNLIEDIDKLKLKGKIEIENDNLSLKQKKEQLAINEKLYGVGQAKIQAEELKKIEKLAGDERIKAINEYYEKQKSVISAISDQVEGQLNLTTDTLLFDKAQFKNIKDFTTAVNKSINETLQTANQQISNTPLIDEKTGEILLESFDKLNEAEKKARLATKKEYEDKAKQEEAFLNATVAAYEDAEFKKLENSKNTTNSLIKLDNEVTDLINQNLDGTTKKAEDATQATNNWYQALSDNQRANFEKTIDFILQASQIIADTISQETDRNIANIERIREAELQAFDESQELREMERNDATAADYQEVIRKRSIADQRLAIEDEFNNKIKAEKIRAFEAQRTASLIEIGINTAVEISKTLANPFLAVLVGLAGAAQAAFVLNSPTPEFAKGGLLDGPSHSQGGIQTQFGELEGGEAVINKKSTKKYMPLLSAINEAGGGVQFASGGVIPSQTIIAEDTSKLDKIEMMLERFASKPILTYVNESDVTRAQRNQRKIEKRTTF